MFHMKHHPQINAYIALLKEWNEIHNLYSKNAYDKLPFHIQDCIQVAEIITNTPLIVLDMGSGAGLPSAIVAIQNPKNTVYAIESTGKKAQFMLHVKHSLRLDNYHPIHDDILHFIHHHSPAPHFITAKAFAPHPKLMDICKKILKKHSPTLLVPINAAQAEAFDHPEWVNRHYAENGYYYIQQPL